ncbi:hypothetical protein AB0M43_05055 [Longispora sp. NPDC051575]|uniref:hypothetical protein n=1 Tax=Longispora sp. NPDC051575 TaxID=3154943 RepID=UPI003428840D
MTGAFVALSGTLLADIRRSRAQRNRDLGLDRWKTYISFALALDSAHGQLREVARGGTQAAERRVAAGRAVGQSRLYKVREQLLMSGTADVVKAGEAAFADLIGIRNAVRTGATTRSAEYHDAYHAFAETLWTFRMAVRRSAGQRPMTPDVLDRRTWSERESCRYCQGADPVPRDHGPLAA